MLSVLLFLAVTSLWYVLGIPIRKRTYNPALLRCSACGAKMYRTQTTGWGGYLSYMTFQIIFWFCVWRLNPPFLIGIGMLLVLLVPLMMATDRTYHAYWRWRHPLRCDGGGHIVPAPSKA